MVASSKPTAAGVKVDFLHKVEGANQARKVTVEVPRDHLEELRPDDESVDLQNENLPHQWAGAYVKIRQQEYLPPKAARLAQLSWKIVDAVTGKNKKIVKIRAYF